MRRALRIALGALLAAFPGPAQAQVMDREIHTFIGFDELDFTPYSDARTIAWDGRIWIGGDFNRIWFKSFGEHATAGGAGDIAAELLYSRLISPFWEFQAGLRLDTRYGGADRSTRGQLALGLDGLAPYWFELEPFLYVSQDGDVSARVEASYELLLTQRLIFEPEVELNAAVQDVPEFGVGSGLNDIEFAVRLRYEIKREIAPYVGYAWLWRTGDTADLARSAGESVREGAFVAGFKVWY